MRKVALLLLLVTPIFGQTATNIEFEAISHGSIAVTFGADSPYQNARVRYVPVSQGTCSDGMSGQVQNNRFGGGNGTGYNRLDITGLAPNTPYSVCVELYNGSAWSESAEKTVTTLPLPSVHPALPIHPTPFDTSYPDTSSYPVIRSSCAGLKSDIENAISQQNQHGTVIELPAGTVCTQKVYWNVEPPDVLHFDQSQVANNTIYMPSHGLAEGQGIIFDSNAAMAYYAHEIGGITNGYIYFVHVLDADHFQIYGDWQQSTVTLTDGSPAIHVDHAGGYASSKPIGTRFGVIGSGIPAGATVTSVIPTGDSNGSATVTLSQAATASGPQTLTFNSGLVPITPGGDPQGAAWKFEPFVRWPRPLNWVIIRTDMTDGQFAPPGTRVNPGWAPKMAALQMPPQTAYGAQVQYALLSLLDGYDANTYYFPSHIRFTGIEFTYSPYPGFAADPVSHRNLIAANFTSTSDIIFDRCWFHGLPDRQDRTAQMFWLQGHNMAIIDSYWDNQDFWHPVYRNHDNGNLWTAVEPTQNSGTNFTIASNEVWYGAANPATLNDDLNISWTGSTTVSSPEIAVYFDMNGALQIVAPQGLSVAANSGIISYTTMAGSGSCGGSDSLIPKDTNGREAAAPLGCATLDANSQISSLVKGYIDCCEDTEGSQSDAGIGPGPYALTNNYISGTGLIWHFDDAGGEQVRGDYLIRRNTWHTPFNHMLATFNLNAQAAGIPSDGYWYGHRQPLEWKAGMRAWNDGNIFDGAYSDVNAGNFVDLTPRTDGSTTDVDATNNTFQHGPIGFSPTTVIDGCCGNYLSWPADRWRLYNNLFWDINGWIYATLSDGRGYGSGAIMPGTGGPAEDNILDHNTFYDFQGYGPQWMHWNDYPLEGLQFTNNILMFEGSGVSGGGFSMDTWENSSNCPLYDQDYMDCAFVSGSTPDYVFKGNVVIPGWATNGFPPSGQVSPSYISGKYPKWAANNTLVSPQSDVPQTYASIKWAKPAIEYRWDANGNYIGTKPDFRLLSGSGYNGRNATYTSGATDGLQAGANMDQLEAAQGKVTLIGANQINQNSASITYVAPDSFSCSVDFSKDDPALINSFTRVQDSGGARVRNVVLTELSSHTAYSYRVNCAVEQPTGKFATN